MSWVSIGALAGLAAIALPILIHMMGRAPARVRRFPSLRFLTASRLLPAKRTKLQDPLLLVLRALVLIAAALALAGPVLNPDTPSGGDSARAVVAIVDTSASVARAASGLGAARRLADSAIAGATSSSIIQTAHPGRAIAGAGAWLSTQRGRPEIVIISDFQLGAVDSADVRGVTAGTALHFRRTSMSHVAEMRTVQGGADVIARASMVGDQTTVTWSRGVPRPDVRIEILAGANETANVSLARQAARVVGVAATALPPRAIAVVYPAYAERAALLAAAGPLRERWQGELVARLVSDALLAGAVASEPTVRDSVASPGIVVARSDDGRPVLSVASSRDTERLLVFVHAGAASETSVALHAALARALAGPENAAESESDALSDAALARLRRGVVPPSAVPSSNAAPIESRVTRWLWALALVLLGAEWLIRRASPSSTSSHVTT